MRTLLSGSLFLLTTLVSAQDKNAFTHLSQMLAENARYRTPVTWEGSQRLRTWQSDTINATTDSVERADWLISRALSPLKLGDYDLAFADYEAAAELSAKSRGEIGWRYLFLLRDYPRALMHLNAFDALTPNYDDPIDDYSVNYLKGRALAGLRRYEEAAAAYTIAIDNRQNRHGPEWVDYRYWVARSVTYLALNQPENALSDLNKALANNPKSAMALYHRGRALQQLKRIAEARDSFRNALFFVRSEPFERDYYYEQPNGAYEGQIEELLNAIKN
ncbi:tetratricopeptide repeat protein [Spirosoma arcticum]